MKEKVIIYSFFFLKKYKRLVNHRQIKKKTPPNISQKPMLIVFFSQ